ncbi:MAG: hypothetical protein I8H73_30925, partial [Pseudomonadales bacterium]|nr:hypothetical protein [Pseudomonadales bacterium]
MNTATNDKDAVRSLLNTGMSERQIAATLNISRRQVKNISKDVHEEDGHNPLGSSLQPTMKQATAVTELVKLSARPGGVRKSELWPMRISVNVTAHFANNVTGG